VIIEKPDLSDEEIVRCCELYSRVGVDFLKTSTGYAKKGASRRCRALMRRHLPLSIQIKHPAASVVIPLPGELIVAGQAGWDAAPV